MIVGKLVELQPHRIQSNVIIISPGFTNKSNHYYITSISTTTKFTTGYNLHVHCSEMLVFHTKISVQ